MRCQRQALPATKLQCKWEAKDMENVEQLEGLVRGAVRAADAVKSFPGTVRVVSHYDADGIASAAIIVRALEREGKEFRLSFVKQLSEDYISGMTGDEELLVIFTDLGSGFIREIGEHLFNKERRVIILDHHQVQGEIPGGREDSVYHVNPVLYGIEEDISGSGVCYLMARALSPVNKDLSELAIIGAIGDSQIGSIGPHWGLLGINKEILKDAEVTGKIAKGMGLRLWGRYGRPVHKALQYSMDPYIPEVTGSESGSVQFLQELGIELKGPTGEWRTLASLDDGETRRLATGIIKERIRNGEENPEWIFGDVYELLDKKGEFRDANEFATMLNGCGKSRCPWIGVGICLNDEGYSGELRKVMTGYRREIGKAVDLVRNSKGMVRVTPRADYILAGDRISEHIVSNVASIIEKSCLVPDGHHKPVFALANTEDGQVKVSGRMNDTLVRQGLSMKDIMAGAVRELGGQGGGHAGAGGATIPAGSEEMFINTVEKLLSAKAGPLSAGVSRPSPVEGGGPAGNSRPDIGKVGGPAGNDNNIKEGAQKIEKAKEAEHEKPEHEGNGAEGEGEGREEQGQERGSQGKAKDRGGGQEVERQGLVRYLFS
jgi:single-stranded-DNA-specific exonuclease